MGNILDGNDYVPMQINRQKDIYMYHPSNIKDKLAGIIINISEGTSYDPLFTRVQQKSAPGTRVIVYHCCYENLELVSEEMRGIVSRKPVIGRILNEMKEIDPDCTIFNWECCSTLENRQFPTEQTMRTLRLILDRQHMAMFSDFSLKALINGWDRTLLGPNPFVLITEFGGNFKLALNRKAIAQCPSSQLQTVASLSRDNTCELKALEKTIVYSVNPEAYQNEVYTIEILSVALMTGIEPRYAVQVENYSGAAGHILLRFKSGGCILASMGHWCELLKVKTSEQQLLKVMEYEYGQMATEELRQNIDRLSGQERFHFIEANAQRLVQQSTPGNHQLRKMKKSIF